MRFAKRSSIRVSLLLAAFLAASAVAVVALVVGEPVYALAATAVATVVAAAVLFSLIVTERRRHAAVEEELAEQASFLESLVESIGRIAGTLGPDEILERTRREAESLFGARATLVRAGAGAPRGPAENSVLIPVRVRDEEVGALQLARSRPFARGDVARATVLADFAARAIENARLLAEAQVREAERARLSDQLITAEQEERRRLALFLHDTSVQSLSGIALMLDAGLHSIETNDVEQAKTVIGEALKRHRATIGALRDLSFNLEPVVLRDQGFGPAVRALADEVGLANEIQVELDVEAGETLAEKAQAGLYQIIREALNQAIRRGPPTKIEVRLRQTEDGGIEAIVADDAPGERRRRSFEAIEERARTLSGRFDVEQGEDGGTAVRVVLPPYAARG